MKRKKNRTRLPRVTVLALNQADLLRFCEAVEALRGLVDDIRAAVEPAKRKRGAKLPPIPSNLPEVPTL